MKFCTKCVMPDTKPNLHFDRGGYVMLVDSQENKNVDIDWGSRKAEFLELIKKYLEYSGFSSDEFWQIVDSFTNKDIFKCDENGKFLHDIDGSLIRKDDTILK